MAESKPDVIIALATIFLIFSTLTTLTRIYVRQVLIKSMGIDDYVMIAAYFSFLGFLICQLIGVHYGTGRHRTGPDGINNDAKAQLALMNWWLCEVFYAPATSLLKISVGFFLLRLVVHKLQIWILRLFIAGSIICGTVYFLLILNQCSPVSFWWNLNPDAQGHCVNAVVFSVLSWIISVLNSTADITFAVVPMFLVANTTMTRKTRVLVCLLLGIASVAGIVTIVRMPYIHTLNHYKGDFLYTTVEVATLTTLEVGLGITAANMATFRPLITRWVGNSSNGTSARATTQNKGNTIHMQKQPSRNGSVNGIQKTTTYITSVTEHNDYYGHHAKSESKEHLNYLDDRRPSVYDRV